MLTHIKISAAKPRAKPYKLFDAHGLFLHVTPTGAKYWRLKYYFGGKERLLALGVYPIVTLQAAREATIDARRLLTNGTDPSLFRQSQKNRLAHAQANTFAALAKEWFEAKKPEWAPGNVRVVDIRLKAHLLPSFGSVAVGDITALAFLQFIRKIEATSPDTAHRVTQLATQILSYAVITGRIVHNPLAELRGALKSHRQKNYPTLQPAELREFWHRLKSIKSPTRMAIMLLAYTFGRPGEIRHARWQDFDFKAKIWIIPPEFHKMGDVHHVPLSTQVLTIIDQLGETRGQSPYLFPAPSNWQKPISDATLNKIIKMCGYHGKLVAHGFRAFASTALNEQGYNADVIERQLGHKPRNKIRAAYNRAEYLPERIKMMQEYADWVDSLIA